MKNTQMCSGNDNTLDAIHVVSEEGYRIECGSALSL